MTARRIAKTTTPKVKKQPSKAATVRALLNKGKTKGEIVKQTGIPYAYVWDIESAWKHGGWAQAAEARAAQRATKATVTRRTKVVAKATGEQKVKRVSKQKEAA